MEARRGDAEAEPRPRRSALSERGRKSLRRDHYRRRSGRTDRRSLSGAGVLPRPGRGEGKIRRTDHDHVRSGQLSGRRACQRRGADGKDAPPGGKFRRGVPAGRGHGHRCRRRDPQSLDQPRRLRVFRPARRHGRASARGRIRRRTGFPRARRRLLRDLRRRVLHRQAGLRRRRRFRGGGGERFPDQVRLARHRADPQGRFFLRQVGGRRGAAKREDHRAHQHFGGKRLGRFRAAPPGLRQQQDRRAHGLRAGERRHLRRVCLRRLLAEHGTFQGHRRAGRARLRDHRPAAENFGGRHLRRRRRLHQKSASGRHGRRRRSSGGDRA